MTIDQTVAPDDGALEEFNPATAEAFAGRFICILNDAAIAVLTSIGHQTGLLETLATLPAATSEQIADASNLNERYVREWLNGMSVAQVLRYDAGSGTYQLPREHAAVITSAAGPNNMAILMQHITMMGDVEQKIIECFRRGGGLSYSDYPLFHKNMAETSAAILDASLLDGVLPLVPGLAGRLTDGIEVADIGCGRGHAINLMAQAFPASSFTGYDFSESAIEAARIESERWGLNNASFEVLDVATLDVEARFDLITAFDAVHDQAHPATVLGNVHRALRDGGTFLMVDIKASSNVEDNVDIPWGSYLYAISTVHCMSVSLALNGDGLGTAWGTQLATSMLADAGFRDVECKEVEADAFNSYFIARK